MIYQEVVCDKRKYRYNTNEKVANWQIGSLRVVTLLER